MEEFPTFKKAEESIGFFDNLFANKIIDFKPKTAAIPAMVNEPTDFRKITKSEILKWEKDKLESYEPIKGQGHWTIGMGNEYYDTKEKNAKGELVDKIVRPGEKITAEDSQRLYNSRMENVFIPAVVKANPEAWKKATDYQKAAMLSVFWHRGVNARGEIYKALQSKNWEVEFPKALESFKSQLPREKGGNGVENRMKANAALFRTKPKQVAGTKQKPVQNFTVTDNPKPKTLGDIADEFMKGMEK